MGRAIEKLKALQLQRLSTKPGVYGDGGGLFLRVQSSTECSWVYRFMLARKRRDMGLGPYPDVSLAGARAMAAEARSIKARGIDPLAQREAVRAAQRVEAARAVTFRSCAEAFIGAHKAAWRNPKHAKQWTSTLNTYAMPIIGDLPVGAVDVSMIHRILEPIWSRKSETAKRVRGRVEAILDWATTCGYRQGDNPARWRGHLENLFPAPSRVRKVKHHRALPYAEIGSFMAALREQAGVGSLALQFTVLTAARTGEVIGATWDEIDLDAGVWTIPPERMKSSREHRVPLARPAHAILRKLNETRGSNALVFPSPKQGKPLSNMAMLETLRRMGRNDLTVHGFRSTFRDWAGERTTYPREVAEAALAHVIGDKVEAAYRRGDLFEKRRRLMNAWGAFCGTGTSERVVVPMRKAGD